MRFLSALIAALMALTLSAGAAAAQTASIAPITLSAELQEKLTDKLGVREGEVLRSALERALRRALERDGVRVGQDAAINIEAEIVDAAPNRPTFFEVSRNTSISYADSFSIGGARLRATIRTPRGVRDVSHHYYSNSLYDLHSPSTWSDADRAMNGFARRVASAVKQAAQ